MPWNKLFSLRIAELSLKHLEQENSIEILQNQEAVRTLIQGEIDKDFEEEKLLDEEVLKLMDNLEKEGHSFERYKMFPLLKKQLAKKKDFVL